MMWRSWPDSSSTVAPSGARVLRPQLEDVAHLDPLLHRQRLPALRTAIALLGFAQIGVLGLKVPPDDHSHQVRVRPCWPPPRTRAGAPSREPVLPVGRRALVGDYRTASAAGRPTGPTKPTSAPVRPSTSSGLRGRTSVFR